MDGISTLLIALGLAMDAFAVSVTSGVTVTHDRLKSAFTAAFLLRHLPGLHALNRLVWRVRVQRLCHRI